MRTFEDFIKASPTRLALFYRLRCWVGPLLQHPIRVWTGYARFFLERGRYMRMGGVAPLKDAYPCLFDRTSETRIDPQYFYQAAWAMRKIVEDQPNHHVDIGSDNKFVGMLSAICKVIFIDIRPLAVQLDQLETREGSLLALPFADRSVRSLSCLHVIEHVGLGRYGDPLDPEGSSKACAELVRVLGAGGRLYLSAPIGRSRVQFNGHRVFSLREIISYHADLRLISLAIIDPHGQFFSQTSLEQAASLTQVTDGQEFSLGCFVFERCTTEGGDQCNQEKFVDETNISQARPLRMNIREAK